MKREAKDVTVKRTVRTKGSMAALGLTVLAVTAAGACSRNNPPPPTVDPAPGTPAANAPPANNTAGAPGTVAQPSANPAAPPSGSGAPTGPAPGAGATPAGPSANLTGEHHVVTVALSRPTAVPGEAALTVEVRATGGFHMNELYPSGLRLAATNATAPAELRRTDAQEATQQRLAFRVPVQVSAAGPTVRGTARFAVCSAENCVPQSQEFAVNLP